MKLEIFQIFTGRLILLTCLSNRHSTIKINICFYGRVVRWLFGLLFFSLLVLLSAGLSPVVRACDQPCAAAADKSNAIKKHNFDIAIQEAGVSLNKFAQQAEQPVLFPLNRVKGIKTNRLAGNYSVDEAIVILLRGTGLRPVFSNSRILTIAIDTDSLQEDDKVRFQKKKISGLIALIVTAFQSGTPVYAQSAAAGNKIDEVVVTASYSGGLKKSLDIKRQASSIADAVIADDIGKLPAVNVAEALQRVPGVTINREAGEGQFVSVRGLGPNFQSVTFNGSPIAVNENVRNSDQSGRQFRFQVIPADLIGGIVVTKSPTADLIDGGIGSNLDLRTINPLQKESFASASLYANFEEQADTTSPNGSLSGGWRNSDETFGVMAGVSYQEREVRFDRLQTFGYSNVTLNKQSARMVSELATTVEQETRERTSFLGGIEWRPFDNFSVSLDALYSKFDNTIAEDRIFYSFGGDKNSVAAIDPASVKIDNGIVTAATIVNGGKISRNAEFSAQEHDSSFINLSADWTLNDWNLTPSLSYSEANSDLPTPLQRIEGETGTIAGLSYGFDFGDDPVGSKHIERLDTNLDLNDPAAVPFRRYRIRPINSIDDDTTFRFDATRDMDFGSDSFKLTQFKTGAQITDRSRDYQRRDRNMVARTGVTVDDEFYSVPVPSDAFSKLISVREHGWAGPDFKKFAQNFVGANNEFDSVFVQADDLVAANADLQNSYTINEDVSALYGRLDYESAFHDVPLRGNIGLRWVQTDTLVEGTILTVATDAGGKATTIAAPTEFDGDYAEWLPSANFNFELQDDVILRLGISKSMTRPSLADLRTAVVPNSAFTSDVFERGQKAVDSLNSVVTGVGGNPQLSPYVSTNLDSSLEWYFSEFGALSISGFHKDIKDFIASVENIETLAFAVDPAKNGGVTTLPVDVLIARPRNVGDATVTGFELAYSDRLQNGLGLSSNLTFVKASVDNNGTEQQLQGVSDFSYTITPFYEQGPFEIHFNWTWRSKHNTSSNISIGTAAAVAGQQYGADGFGTLDFGASWKLNDYTEFFAEGVNLTEERQAAFVGKDDVFLQAHSYGRTFNLGVKVKL